MEQLTRIFTISSVLLPGDDKPIIKLPTQLKTFLAGFVCYFFLIAGVVYDVINEPGSMGQQVDKKSGQIRPVAFLAGRINGQYILEGMAAAIVFVIGSVGFIILDKAYQHGLKRNHRLLLLIIGGISVTLSFIVINVFMFLKLPKYLQ